MNLYPLRNHGEPCEHCPEGDEDVPAYRLGHSFFYAPAHSAWCPGGRLVKVDYEAAVEYGTRFFQGARAAKRGAPPHIQAGIRKIVDAALGETREQKT